MVRSLKRRLTAWEESAGGSSECPECGFGPHERRPPAVIDEEHPDKSFEGDPRASCARCKDPLYTVLRVVYGDEEGGGDSYWRHAPA